MALAGIPDAAAAVVVALMELDSVEEDVEQEVDSGDAQEEMDDGGGGGGGGTTTNGSSTSTCCCCVIVVVVPMMLCPLPVITLS